MKIRFITSTLALAALALAPAAFAQTGAAGAPATAKIAVLNVRQAIGMTSEGKSRSAEMQTQFSAQQTELENIQKQAEDIQQQLAKNDRAWSDDEKTRRNTQLQLLQRQFTRRQDDLNEQVQAATNEAMDVIGRKMSEIVDKYARDNGFAAVIDGGQGSVLYVSPQVEITNEIVKLYDAQYPAKAGAAAPKPGATNTPATKQPGTPATATNPPAKKPGGQL